MLLALLPWIVACVLAAGGLLVGWLGETSTPSAVLLQAEPLLLVGAVWSIAVCRWTRRGDLALGISMGTIAAVAAVRLPLGSEPIGAEPPEWISPVHRCAVALAPPSGPVHVLQWTLDGSEPAEDIRAVVAATEPDIVVLHGVTDDSLVGTVLDRIGGEARVRTIGVTRVGIVAAGGFHPCGEADEWGNDGPDGYTLNFVGVPPDTVFPLVTTRLPGSLDVSGWADHVQASRQGLANVLSGLQGASVMVVADAGAPRTWRRLDATFTNLGLGGAALPPSWPTRVGPAPMWPLHPYARLWYGPVWRAKAAHRVVAPSGSHAPVYAEFTGPPDTEPAPVERRPPAPGDPRLESAPEQ